jgi:hypothetical protein
LESSTIAKSNQDCALAMLRHTIVCGINNPALNVVARADTLVYGGQPKLKRT